MSEDITYEALNFDGLERRGNYRFIAFREDMLHALDKKDSAAIVYQIVYRWQTEYKKEEVTKKIDARKKSGQKPYTQEEVDNMMYVYMSYNDFVRESGGAVGYNTVIRTIDYLVHDIKALRQKENHDPKYSDYEYSVNREVVRELLKALPVQPPFSPKVPKKKNSSTQMGTPENSDDQSTQMGTGSTQTGIPSTQMGTGVYPNGCTSQELTRNTQDHTEEESITPTTQPLETFASNDAIHTLIEEMMKRLEVVEQENQSLRSDNQSLLEKLSTQAQQLPTSNTQDKPTSTEADEQASYSHPATENLPPTLPNGKENNKRTKKDATQDLTLQGSHVIEVYEAFKKRKITRNTGNVKAANGLGEVVETDQDLNEVLTLMANDKFLKEHGVRIDLDFVYRKYDGFLDRVDKLREQAKKRTSGNNNYPDMSNASIEETDPYVLATMRSAGRLLATVN